eukprot:s301_g9.t2
MAFVPCLWQPLQRRESKGSTRSLSIGGASLGVESHQFRGLRSAVVSGGTLQRQIAKMRKFISKGGLLLSAFSRGQRHAGFSGAWSNLVPPAATEAAIDSIGMTHGKMIFKQVQGLDVAEVPEWPYGNSRTAGDKKWRQDLGKMHAQIRFLLYNFHTLLATVKKKPRGLQNFSRSKTSKGTRRFSSWKM